MNWSHQQYIPILNYLLDKKADVNVENEFGITALDVLIEQRNTWEGAREKEQKDQKERREIMEGRGPVGWGYGTAEDARKMLIWNRPLVDELDEFKDMNQIYEGLKLLEGKGAKEGEDPFNPSLLTTEDFVTKRDKLINKYKDAKYEYS